MRLRPCTREERAQVRALLIDSKLPVADLDAAAIDFIVALDAERVIGAIGLEAYAPAGLLRSLAVRDDCRGSGVGAALVQALEAQARERGLRQLLLLTETAQPFFARRGYAVVERRLAPPALRDSAEFRSLCPASAVCMQKDLGDRP